MTDTTNQDSRTADDVQLRDVVEDDLPILFEHQWDPAANRLAAVPARDREAFMAHWTRILADSSSLKQAIISGGQVVGNLVCFEMGGLQQVGYWIGRDYWGRGIATRALAMFLEQISMRPLYGVVANHNGASLRVLEKCGFAVDGNLKEFSNFGGETVEGIVLKLGTAEEDTALDVGTV